MSEFFIPKFTDKILYSFRNSRPHYTVYPQTLADPESGLPWILPVPAGPTFNTTWYSTWQTVTKSARAVRVATQRDCLEERFVLQWRGFCTDYSLPAVKAHVLTIRTTIHWFIPYVMNVKLDCEQSLIFLCKSYCTWFVIVLTEIGTRRILREKADCLT